jgi:hypothetical protein
MTRTRLLAAVLLALALRSLIPVGFMPATDGSLSLIMCHDGFPPALLSGHGSHGHGVRDNDHCGFCTGFSAAPPSQLPAALVLLLAGMAAVAVALAAPAGIRLVHLPQARAPPALL